MSRLFGRCDDVYSVSKYLRDTEMKFYSSNKSKTTWEEIENTPGKIELYLPENAIKLIEDTPVRLVKSFFAFKPMMFVPFELKEEPLMVFPKGTPKEEYKKDLAFFIGRILANHSHDLLPKEFDLACTYHDVLPLVLEYLYLKENNEEDQLFLKYSRDLLKNAKKYIKIYELYEKYQDSLRELMYTTERLEEQKEKNKQAMLKKILTNLVPLASMDATLQITDKYKDPDDYKKLIEELIENPNHNREEIIKKRNIETYGFKRLRKEIDRVSDYY